jgi:hypothetical protein
VDSDVSTTQLIVVGLLSGAAGALLTTLMRMGHEREEALRTRMIAAADDLASGLVQALMAFRPFRDPRITADGVAQAAMDVRRRADEATAHLARMDLLFGPGSPEGVAAGAMIASLQLALAQAERPWRDIDVQAVARHATAANASLAEFNRVVHARVATPRWRQALRRARGKLPWVG